MEKKFDLPVNVKQIGNINPDMKLKIYIEDYAYNYLKQYAKAEKYHERLAFLIGKNIKESDKDIVLISGAIKTEFLQREQEILIFTRETWKQAYEQIEKYFSGLEIVGLMQSQPKYKNYLNEKYVSQFKNNFMKPNQIFLLYDPIENKEVFYVLDEERKNLKEVESYFIYYEKNDAMNEYMIENQETKKNRDNEIMEKNETPEILARKKQFERIQKTNYEQKKIVNMLTSLSIILFLICFIMGAGLIQNEDRIAKLEARLKNIDGYCKNCNEQKIKSVFFEKDDFVDDKEKEKNDEDKKNMEIEKYELDEREKNKDKNVDDIEFEETDENNLIDNKPKTNEKLEDKNNIFDDKQNDLDVMKNEQHIERAESENNFREKTEEEKELDKTKNKKADDKLRTYTVKDGDSLSLISQKFFGNTKMIDEILKLNDMDDADKIYAGKILKLPKKKKHEI